MVTSGSLCGSISSMACEPYPVNQNVITAIATIGAAIAIIP